MPIPSISPWLFLAVGNPSRGDDALGPRLIEHMTRIEAAADDVEFLVDFQLQVEHALDLQGRMGVLFVDAAHSGSLLIENGGDSSNDKSVGKTKSSAEGEPMTVNKYGAAISRIMPAEKVPVASHALRADAVLHVSSQFDVNVPPSWQLAIEGSCFSLGEGLSKSGEAHLDKAILLATMWLKERRNSIARTV